MSTLTSIMAFFQYEPGARTSDRPLGSPWWKKLASLSQGCEQELLIADCRWEITSTYLPAAGAMGVEVCPVDVR